MEGVVERVRRPEDAHILVLFKLLTELLLYEARDLMDYRLLFPFLIRRISAHIVKLMQESAPVLVGEMVFLSDGS